MGAKTKRVILFIVEGPTDEEALSPILKRIFKKDEIHFHVVHGDVTADRKVNGTNAKTVVNDHIKQEMGRYGFKKQDILKVVHLIDTDGAFIPEDKVLTGQVKGFQYLEDCIVSANPGKVIDRNKRKSAILSRLCTTDSVGKLPYMIYYFSRNLEHVLHNVSVDITNEEKVEYADEFADSYLGNTEKFKSFMASKEIAAAGDYKETWEFIMEDVNSLHRYSNLHLILYERN